MLEQWKSRWDGRLAAVLLGRGGVAAVREGEEESVPFASGPVPAAIRQVGGGGGDGGTRCRLPSTGGAVRQEAEECQAVHQRCPVPSHGTTSKSRSAARALGPTPLATILSCSNVVYLISVPWTMTLQAVQRWAAFLKSNVS